MGLSNIHFAVNNRADQKLRMAHEEIEHLAKVAERERIARDLHDVLGHTLTLISVKSTLAGKLLDKDPEKARSEIADIEKVSRDAMSEIRNTLRGYSSYKLSEEMERAQATLESAGVAVNTESSGCSPDPSAGKRCRSDHARGGNQCRATCEARDIARCGWHEIMATSSLNPGRWLRRIEKRGQRNPRNAGTSGGTGRNFQTQNFRRNKA